MTAASSERLSIASIDTVNDQMVMLSVYRHAGSTGCNREGAENLLG
ncbi:MAG: hypothetical protein AB8U72_04610 [Anaplasma ovis]